MGATQIYNEDIADGTIGISDLSATGTPSSSTFLRGDNTWAPPAGGGSSGYSNRIIYSAAYVASNTFTLAATPTKIYQVLVYNSSTAMNVPVAAYTWTAGTNTVTVTDTLQSGDTVYFDVELAATAATSYVPNTVINTSITTTATTTQTVKTFYRCDATSGSFTITLITAVGNSGLELTFKKIDSTTNIITLDGAGTETIDGGLTAVIQRQYSSLTLISDNVKWHII